MAGILTTEQKATIRTPGPWSRAFLAIPEYHTIYTAELMTVPTSNDLVAEILFDTGAGTLAAVLPDMTLYVGTTPGAYDLGLCRIRKAPIAGTFYIGATSEIEWDTPGTIYLTVVDDYSLWQKTARIVGGASLMDWDVAYTDQHEDFHPIPCMGTHRVKRLVGESVSVRLGPADDTEASVFDSTITDRTWSLVGGGTLDNPNAVNPNATFEAAGTYLAYCEFEAATGKTFTGVRYVIIYDDENPLIEAFDLSEAGGSIEKGGYSFNVNLFANTLQTDLRKRSLVILCVEDFNQDGPVTIPGQIEGAENIVCVGWIADINNNRTSETGRISFTVESAEYWLRQIRDFPTDLTMQTVSAGSFKTMPALNVARAAWHFLHWRSNATRVLDVQLTEDTRLKDKFITSRSNMWERLQLVSQNTIFAAPLVDNLGRLFIHIDPQMVLEGDRDFPVAMQILDDDIQGEIEWVRRDVRPLSMLFLSGQSFDLSTNSNTFFAMGAGHAYSQHGGEDSQDNYLVESQEHAIALCGTYLGWRNNPIDSLLINFVNSMRYAAIAPRQYFYYEVAPADDPRGIGFEANLIPRTVRFSINPITKFLSVSVLFEPESFALPSIEGDPPGLEDIDFSTPSIPAFPSLPDFPIVAFPPTELNPNHPKKVIIGSANFGVFFTENFNADTADVVWKAMNSGLDSDDRTGIAQLEICPNGSLWLVTCNFLGNAGKGRRRIYWASGLGAAWNLYYDAAEHDDEWVTGLGVNPNKSEEIVFHTSEVFVPAVLGGTWTGSKFNIGNRSGFNAFPYDAQPFPASPEVFSIREYRTCILLSKDIWWLFGSRAGGVANTPRPLRAKFGTDGTFIDEAEFTVPASADGVPRNGVCPGGGDLFFVWSEGTGGYTEFTVDGTTQNTVTDPDPGVVQGMAFSPTGTHGMCVDLDSLAAARKTTDSAATWSAPASGLLGPDVYASCGDNNRFIIAGGTSIYLTVDLGDNTINKGGNLGYLAGLIDITNARFVA